MARHNVTIKDIAEHLGISHTTVSRALADHPHTSNETKARVRSAAAEMGYVADLAARVMRGQRSTLIGLIIPDIQNDFYATVAKALTEVCNKAGFQLVLANTEDDSETELMHVRALWAARAAGVLIVPSDSVRRETVDLLEDLPVVQMIRYSRTIGSDWLGIDDEKGIAEATRHLLNLGHRQIAYIGGHEGLSTGAARLNGFRLALTEAGLWPAPALIQTGAPRAAFGRETTARLLDGQQVPTAIVTGGSRITHGVLEALEERRVRIPRDLSLVGYGDSALFRWWQTGLTTVGLPVRDIALAAGDLAIRRIRERAVTDTPPATQSSATYPPFLVVRGSTAPLHPDVNADTSGNHDET